jgi:hypothetical protein
MDFGESSVSWAQRDRRIIELDLGLIRRTDWAKSTELIRFGIELSALWHRQIGWAFLHFRF